MKAPEAEQDVACPGVQYVQQAGVTWSEAYMGLGGAQHARVLGQPAAVADPALGLSERCRTQRTQQHCFHFTSFHFIATTSM